MLTTNVNNFLALCLTVLNIILYLQKNTMKTILITVKNYATLKRWTTGYVYQLIAKNKIKFKIIDGVYFIKIKTK